MQAFEWTGVSAPLSKYKECDYPVMSYSTFHFVRDCQTTPSFHKVLAFLTSTELCVWTSASVRFVVLYRDLNHSSVGVQDVDHLFTLLTICVSPALRPALSLILKITFLIFLDLV